MQTETGHTCRFGPYEVCFAERKVRKQEQTIRLTPKVFDTLSILLQNRERVMSKHELLEAVWPDRFVDEANLTQNISVLRKALGETDSATKYIGTFPGKGYRFIAEVQEPDVALASRTVIPVEVPDMPTLDRGRNKRFKIALWAGVLVGAGLIFLGLSVCRRSAAGSLFLGPSTVVTHLPGRAYQPAISPDGSSVAFVLHDSLKGARRLAIQKIGSNSQPNVLAAEGGDVFSPTWSPDGTKLAYLQFSGPRLYVMVRKASGESEPVIELFPRRYELTARQLDWSPDGRLLAVSDKYSDEEPFGIELVHLAERRKIPLTHPPALSDGDFAPRFSPDGKRLAFVRQIAGGVTRSYFMELPGADPQPIPQAGRAVGDLDWTPDSRSILSSSGDSGASFFWQLNVDGKRIEMKRSGAVAEGPVQFSISRGTGDIVFGLSEPEQNVWRATVNQQQGVTGWQPWITSKARNYFPVYSNSGREVVFLSERSGEDQAWIKDSEGREHQLTAGQLRPWYASWTRNDDALVFSSLALRKMFTVSPQTRSTAAVPIPSSVGSHTAVSLDGRTVYFVRRFYILAAPIDGKTPPRQLTDQGGFPLRLSSDGKWLYYARNRFSNEIWRVSTASGRAEKVTNRLQPGSWSAWSVSNDSLVYLASTDGCVARKLERLDLISGQVYDFGELPGRLPALGMGALALSPDSKFLLAVVSQPGSGDIHFITDSPWSLHSRLR